MAHIRTINHTAFAFEPLFLADRDGRALFVALLKATFVLGEEGRPLPALRQLPISFGGEPWAIPGRSSQRLAPEAVAVKPATDVVLLGHAVAPRAGATETVVGLHVGPIRKLVRVVGDRHWVRRGIGQAAVMSAAQPFERMPLRWERAFGGWDRHQADPALHRCEPRNPVGVGFRTGWHRDERFIPLPNLEHPEAPLRRFDDRPCPVGFGFVSPDWQPRLALAGTYDAHWRRSRMPLLPADFDPRFFNAAPEDQVVAGYLTGLEEVTVVNASPGGRLHMALPGKGRVPRMEATLRDRGPIAMAPVLDTLVLDTDARLLTLLWRAEVPVSDVPHEVVSIEVEWGRRVPVAAQAARD